MNLEQQISYFISDVKTNLAFNEGDWQKRHQDAINKLYEQLDPVNVELCHRILQTFVDVAYRIPQFINPVMERFLKDEKFMNLPMPPKILAGLMFCTFEIFSAIYQRIPLVSNRDIALALMKFNAKNYSIKDIKHSTALALISLQRQVTALNEEDIFFFVCNVSSADEWDYLLAKEPVSTHAVLTKIGVKHPKEFVEDIKFVKPDILKHFK